MAIDLRGFMLEVRGLQPRRGFWECIPTSSAVHKAPAETCHTNGLQKRVTRVSVGEENPPKSARVGAVNGPTFEEFVAQHGRRLVGLAYTLVGSHSVAEDLVQDAMIAAYRRWDEVGRMDDPAAWVRRVVANRSVSHVRRRITEARGLARLAGQRQEPVIVPVSDESEALWAAVRRLPRRQRQIIALRYHDQLSMSEIADTLGCSKESVNTHLRRARATLSRLYPEGESR
jgi:RNA polymerase sigma-70 factor (sigma-E family)